MIGRGTAAGVAATGALLLLPAAAALANHPVLVEGNCNNPPSA